MSSENIRENVQWTEYTSNNGVKFKFGPVVGPADDTPNDAPSNVDSEVACFSDSQTIIHSVYWELEEEPGSWKEPTQDIKDLGISRYKLIRDSDGPVLRFTNTKGWKFVFRDMTDDAYTVTTVWNRDHCLTYESDRPTIVGVSN